MPGRFDFLEIPGGGEAPATRLPRSAPASAPAQFPAAPMRIEVVEVIGTHGRELGQFVNPTGLCVASDGALFVADTGNHRVQKITADGDVIGLGGHGEDSALFNSPISVTLDNQANLFVLSMGDSTIKKFSPTGRLHHSFGARGALQGQLDMPLAIALDHYNNVWVSDAGNSRVQVFAPNGKFEGVFALRSGLPRPLAKPCSVFLLESAVYVADAEQHCIIRFDNEGRAEYTLGSPGSSVGQLNRPASVVVDALDNLFVLEEGNNRVQLFPCDDEPRVLFDARSNSQLQLSSPRGLALGLHGSVYVSDSSQHRVVHFRCA